MKDLNENEALHRAIAYCSGAEHCNSEVSSKLIQWGITDTEAHTRILQHLNKEKYIDESRYCRFFVSDKLRLNKWGRKKIAMALSQKALPKSIITDALNSINEDEYEEILVKVLLTKIKSLHKYSNYEKQNKLLRFALGRGFEFDISKEIIAKKLTLEFCE